MAKNSAILNLIINGEPKAVRMGMAGTVAAERRWGKTAFDEHPVEAGAYAAWFTLGMPGGADGFDAWLQTVEMDLPDDEETADPTPAAAPSEPSPQSQPPQD
jgi:hypothetical protein